MYVIKCVFCYIKNMDEVRTLLREINQEEMYSLFEKEEITLQELLEMGHAELESIGIQQFGRRQKIINVAKKRGGDYIFRYKYHKNMDAVSLFF